MTVNSPPLTKASPASHPTQKLALEAEYQSTIYYERLSVDLFYKALSGY